MMAIVSSTKEVSSLGGGRLRMVGKHTDDSGKVYEQRTILLDTDDADAILAQGAAALAERLAEEELQELLS